MTQTPPILPPPPSNPYARFFGRWIAVNVDDTVGDEESFTTVTGKVTEVSATAMVVRGNNKTVIVDFKKIIDDIEIQSAVAKSRVQRRKLLDPGANVRKHLGDRHGVKLAILNGLTEEAAKLFHDNIDHSVLAHRHEGEPDRHEADSSRARPIRQRKIDDSDRSTRQHLADRHGLPVKTLNAMPDALIKRFHDEIDHSTLSHRHTDKPAGVANATPRIPGPRLPVLVVAPTTGISSAPPMAPLLPFPAMHQGSRVVG